MYYLPRETGPNGARVQELKESPEKAALRVETEHR